MAREVAFSSPKPPFCTRLQDRVNRAIKASGGKVMPSLKMTIRKTIKSGETLAADEENL